jgi:hypothetical protein
MNDQSHLSVPDRRTLGEALVSFAGGCLIGCDAARASFDCHAALTGRHGFATSRGHADRSHMMSHIENDRASSLRAAVRMCRRSVRAGAFACELVTRRPWLDARHARWIAENLSALRGWTVEVTGDAPAEDATALVIDLPCATAALAVLAAVPLGSMGPSLAAGGEPWWPHGAVGPVLMTTADGEELGRLAARAASIVPVAVELTSSADASRRPRSHVTRARLAFGARLQLAPGRAGWEVAARARGEIERLLARLP